MRQEKAKEYVTYLGMLSILHWLTLAFESNAISIASYHLSPSSVLPDFSHSLGYFGDCHFVLYNYGKPSLIIVWTFPIMVVWEEYGRIDIRLATGHKMSLTPYNPILFREKADDNDDKGGKARSDMTVEERIEAADRRKIEGNALFKEEKLEEAMQQYEMAIAYMGDDFMFQLYGKYRDMALSVKNPCHLNMAACFIKLKRYDEAIGQCSMVLSEDENNVKALFRRGKARAELGQTDSAREDFLKAKKFAPEDKAIARELRLLAEHDKAVYQKQKELYKGIFGSRPEPKPKSKRSWIAVFWLWLVSLLHRLFKKKEHKED